MEKVEMVIKRMRWKAIYFENKDISEKITETYGLKSLKCPKQVRELIPFEKDLVAIFKNIKFRKINNNFQENLNKDIRTIKQSSKTMTFADKTSNMYRLTKDQYDHILNNAVTSTYKKASNKIKEKINIAGKNILKNDEILNRMEINGESNCFITLKDHNDNFENNPTVRLLNPAKNELGRISKVILQKLNLQLRQKLEINQWQNTQNVIDWFQQIQDKNKHKFINFDIKDFYPSITEQLLVKALNFAEKHVKISKKDKSIIYHARKSLLFNKEHTWIKKKGGLFDVTMGAYDGAEICELVGIYLLFQITQKYDKNSIGLYRDDGLGAFKNVSGPESEKIKKHLQKLFNENNLKITIQCNLKIVNFLDVTFNLSDSTFRPYHKPNDEINYIHRESNHPPSIIKQLPISIESRLSKLSSSEKIFKESTYPYQNALNKSGFKYQLTYQHNQNTPNTQQKRQRKRKIIWFNPPYSKNVTTKVGKIFLSLINKHFPEQHKFHKIFNKNNVKVSYSCMPNIKSIINMHNKKIVNPPQQTNERTCNCIKKPQCPLQEKCLTNNVLYRANISPENQINNNKVYFGVTKTAFKKRYANHVKSFRHEQYQNDTELSVESWKMKNNGTNAAIKFEIKSRHQPYNVNTKRCSLCLNEKLEIALYKGTNLLNKRTEIINKCRHSTKYALASYVIKD